MNYILQLQKQIENQNQAILAFKNGIQDLRNYLNSPKFNCGDRLDGYVNIQDVFLRLDEIKNQAWEKEIGN